MSDGDDGMLVYGDPVLYLMATFRSLYPDVRVRLAYIPDIQALLQGGGIPVHTYRELDSVFPNLAPEEQSAEGPPIEERDETTGSLIAVIKCQSETLILLDYFTPATENITLLLDTLPRLLSNPEDEAGTVGNQFTYSVVRKKLESLLQASLDHFCEKVLPTLTTEPMLMGVVHNEYPVSEGEEEQGGGDDSAEGGRV